MAHPAKGSVRTGRKRIFIACSLLTLLLVSSCANTEINETRKLAIKSIDLQQTHDGMYTGEYSYGKFEYKVDVVIKDHQIKEINVLNNRGTKHAKMAEAVIAEVLKNQKNDVDVVSGATTTSKALLKAIEEAITRSL
jgi:uncharacterized protein with FMN-binding domain